jgi:hypothetical protein
VSDEEHNHGDTKLKIRTVACIEVTDEMHVTVEHVFDNETCPEHGNLIDSGLVAVAIHDETPGEEQFASVLLEPRDALLLADRITRAAHLALELDEQLPDPQREYLRHSERQYDEP